MNKYQSKSKQDIKKKSAKTLGSHTISPHSGPAERQKLDRLSRMYSVPAYLPLDFISDMRENGIPPEKIKVSSDRGLRALGQRAYARGNEIHIDSDIPLSSTEGRFILKHELIHVIQQGRKQLTHGNESDWEYQANGNYPISGNRTVIPEGTDGYPAQGIEKFPVEQDIASYEKLCEYMSNFNAAVDQQEGGQEAMFHFLHQIDLQVHDILNREMDPIEHICFQDLPAYSSLQKILELSDKNYIELTAQLIKNGGRDGAVPIDLETCENLEMVRWIWGAIRSRDSKIQIQDTADQEFENKIYAYMGKMLHYNTGIGLLAAALKGKHAIKVLQDDSPNSPCVTVNGNDRNNSLKSIAAGRGADRIQELEDVEEFKKNFLKILDGQITHFPIGNNLYFRGTGTEASIHMPKTLPQTSMTTGTNDKQTLSPPWLIFAHEMGHAVRDTHGMHLDLLTWFTDQEHEFFTPNSKNPEELINNHVVENPLRHESHMRKRMRYVELETALVNEFVKKLFSKEGHLHVFYTSLELLANDEFVGTDDMRNLLGILQSTKTIHSKFAADAHALTKLEDQLRAIRYVDAQGRILDTDVKQVKGPVADRIRNDILNFVFPDMDTCGFNPERKRQQITKNFNRLANEFVKAGQSIKPIRKFCAEYGLIIRTAPATPDVPV